MKLLVCAGGTGGHIFPGIAVAEAFMDHDEHNEVVFVGTTGGMEGKIVPRYGFRLLFVEARQFQGRNILYKAATLASLMRGIFTARLMLKREKPDAILGTGGFTCVPTLLAGASLRIPSFIQEQNVEPGLANKFLSKFVSGIFTSFEETRNYVSGSKVYFTGNPVRKILQTRPGQKEGGNSLNLFVFGGSRGAHSINQAVLSLIPFLPAYGNVALCHQTGTDDFEMVKKACEASGITHEVFPFTEQMGKYYMQADIVISRAGASTIFELAFFRKAAILIPYPFAAGGHQWRNGALAEKLGGCLLLKDAEATGERLNSLLKPLAANPQLLRNMGENMGKIYVADAAERIVGHICNNAG